MDIRKGFWLRSLFAVVLSSVICGDFFGADAADNDPEGKVIESVKVVGNVSRDRRILAAAEIFKGEVFSKNSASRGVERIAELEGVSSSAYVDPPEVVDGKVRLVFVVTEQRLIRSIVFLVGLD